MMLRAFAILILLTIAAGCAHRSPSPKLYVKIVDGDGEIDEFRNEWYGKHLAAMGQSRLPWYDGRWATALDFKELHVLRVLYLPTWGPPLCLRIDIDVDVTEGALLVGDPFGGKETTYELTGGNLTVIRTDGQGGYEPGKVSYREVVSLSKAQIEKILNVIDRMNFLNLPTSVPKMGGLDGEELIVELAYQNRYHVVDRWSPGAFGDEESEKWIRENRPYFNLKAYRATDQDLIEMCRLILDMADVEDNEFSTSRKEKSNHRHDVIEHARGARSSIRQP